MNETNHPARRLRHGDRPTEPLVFDDAAANKAAEEGGLPALPKEDLFLDCIDYYNPNQMRAYALKAITADRASRQVANKAEVDPVVPQGFAWPEPPKGGQSHVLFDDGYAEGWAKAIETVRNMLATPPATTGASTARDQALEEAARLSEEMYESGEGGAGTKEAAARIRALKGSVGASTVLTDERSIASIDTARFADFLFDWHSAAPGAESQAAANKLIAHIDQHVAREVAAQAGQVAVPVCSCPSGDGSLRFPCPTHPPMKEENHG